jgi:hypothetical protein
MKENRADDTSRSRELHGHALQQTRALRYMTIAITISQLRFIIPVQRGVIGFSFLRYHYRIFDFFACYSETIYHGFFLFFFSSHVA